MEHSSFLLRSTLDLRINHYKRAVVSIPSLYGDGSQIETKDLLSSGPVSSVGKFTTEEHLGSLLRRGVIQPDTPLLVFGLRNTLVNYRCIAQLSGKLHSISPEMPELSKRPYYGLVIQNGEKLSCETRLWQPDSHLAANETFISGIPVGWDTLSREELANTQLIEAADHSHLYKLPRGNHPDATDESRSRWQGLNSIFVESIHKDEISATIAMRSGLESGSELIEEDDYLHQVIACNKEGDLYICAEHNSLASIGQRLSTLGFNRSICVENSGSVQPSYFPKGAIGPEIQLLRAANFRPSGRALLVLELDSPNFGFLNPSNVSVTKKLERK